MPAPFGPMMPTMPPGGSLTCQIVDQEIVAKAFAQMLEVDDVLPEPLGDRDDDLRGLRLLLAGLFQQFLVALVTRLGFRLPRPRRSGDPFLLARERALVRLVLAAFLFEPLLLLLEPRRVIALVGNAAAAIELENPAGDVVEEIAVVGDDEDGARIVAQVAFEPHHQLGIEVIGRLVEQQQLRLLQKQPAERDTPPLAAGKLRHLGIVGRAAQRIHRLIDLGVEVPQSLGLDLVLQLGHLVGGLVGIVHRQLVVAVDDRLLRRHPLHDVLAHRFGRIELRLLRQVADAGALGGPSLAGKLGVEAGHDAQQRRLAGAVDAEHADLGIGIERQVDVLQDLAVARIGLGEPLHMVDELPRHQRPALLLGAAPPLRSSGATANALMLGSRR